MMKVIKKNRKKKKTVKLIWVAIFMMGLLPAEPFNTMSILEIPRLDAPINIDGVLENTWPQNAHFNRFAMFQPQHLQAATVETEGYIAHDDQNLYVAFICHDPDMSQLRSSLTDRDKIFQDDFIGVVLDPQGNLQEAFEFFVNPYGIQADVIWQPNLNDGPDPIWQPDGGEDLSFEAIWESETQIQDDRWITEIRIPFNSMKFPPNIDQDWLVHLVRVYPREHRYQFSWRPISHDVNSFLGQAGHIKFSLERQPEMEQRLELLPYVITWQDGNSITESDGNKTWDTDSPDQRLGLTGKFRITTNSTMQFAYRPDFSQIEADAGRITANSPYAVFYPERRPFFVEGNEAFMADRYTQGLALDNVANLVYTRMIKDPLYAAKLTGSAGRFSYGFISAYDEATPFILPFTDASVVLNTDRPSRSHILRTRYNLGEQTHFGILATHRNHEGSAYNTAVLTDFRWLMSQNYRFSIMAAVTDTKEMEDVELTQSIQNWVGDYRYKADGDSLTAAFDGERFQGTIFKTRFQRQARNWSYSLGYQDFSPGVRAENSTIFTNDGRIFDAWTGYNFYFEDHPIFQMIQPQLTAWRKFDYEGDVKDTGLKGQAYIQLNNQTGIYLAAFLFNREKYQGITFPDARNLVVFINSQRWEKFTWEAQTVLGETINRMGEADNPRNPLELAPNLDINGEVTYRPTDRLIFNLAYNSSRLWTQDDEVIYKQQIFRPAFTYQFTKQIYTRFIGELNFFDYYNSGIDDIAEHHTYSLESLVGIKLNAYSLFYLGWNNTGNISVDDPEVVLTRADGSLFLKFQYLFDAL